MAATNGARKNRARRPAPYKAFGTYGRRARQIATLAVRGRAPAARPPGAVGREDSHHPSGVRPRWDDRPVVWRKLLLAAASEEMPIVLECNAVDAISR